MLALNVPPRATSKSIRAVTTPRRASGRNVAVRCDAARTLPLRRTAAPGRSQPSFQLALTTALLTDRPAASSLAGTAAAGAATPATSASESPAHTSRRRETAIGVQYAPG